MQSISPVAEAAQTDASLEKQIAALGPWFHNLHLRGIQTAPAHFLGDYPQIKYEHFNHALPEDLTGKSVLDIGCNAGFYSLEMKRRGADRVLGIDSDEHYLAQARFAADVLGLDVQFEPMSVWQIASLRERFDLVIFMGVLYHLRHPLLALDLIHEHVARDLLLFQSMLRGSDEVATIEPDYDFHQRLHFDEPDYPKLHFIEHRYSHDETNWCRIARVRKQCCDLRGLRSNRSLRTRFIFAVGAKLRFLLMDRIACIPHGARRLRDSGRRCGVTG
jgi:tRNA (mo5U34)-methyltransferase